MIAGSGGLSVEQGFFLVGPEKLHADLLAGLLLASERAGRGPHHVVGVKVGGFRRLWRASVSTEFGRGRVVIGAGLREPLRTPVSRRLGGVGVAHGDGWALPTGAGCEWLAATGELLDGEV